jgi:hypothetical protein
MDEQHELSILLSDLSSRINQGDCYEMVRFPIRAGEEHFQKPAREIPTRRFI